jgi:hypothetical protein
LIFTFGVSAGLLFRVSKKLGFIVWIMKVNNAGIWFLGALVEYLTKFGIGIFFFFIRRIHNITTPKLLMKMLVLILKMCETPENTNKYKSNNHRADDIWQNPISIIRTFQRKHHSIGNGSIWVINESIHIVPFNTFSVKCVTAPSSQSCNCLDPDHNERGGLQQQHIPDLLISVNGLLFFLLTIESKNWKSFSEIILWHEKIQAVHAGKQIELNKYVKENQKYCSALIAISLFIAIQSIVIPILIFCIKFVICFILSIIEGRFKTIHHCP